MFSHYIITDYSKSIYLISCKIKCLNPRLMCFGDLQISDSAASPQVSSPWSESMSQLMIKLDQLNLDIEQALSANSSPCGTPGTTRKTQVSALYAVYISRQLADWLLRSVLYTFLSSCCRLVFRNQFTLLWG